MRPLQIVILAAGKGTRMHSGKPKVMHTLGGKPLLQHVIETALRLQPTVTQVVVGHGAEAVQAFCENWPVETVKQTEQKGTGHAVQQALPGISDEAVVLILYGDVPLLRAKTLQALVDQVSGQSLAILTGKLPNPTGYGRILRNEDDEVCGIVEEKDATEAQKILQEVNTGVLAVSAGVLHKLLPQLQNNNAQGEYYLTDLVASTVEQGIPVRTLQATDLAEVQGINDRLQQAQLERQYQYRQAQALMRSGLTLLDPHRFDCRGRLSVGDDCVIDINCVFEGDVVLGNNVTIGPNCVIKNTAIADNTIVHANSMIEDADVDDSCSIGPFARLRRGTVLQAGARIGNFVETKKARIGPGSKINHLSYVGDAEVGRDVNVGAGTITCNYDGVNKHKTEIGDNVFVGSNSALIAPVTIGAGTTIAAGSTVTCDSTEDQLVVARSRQRNIDGWRRPRKK